MSYRPITDVWILARTKLKPDTEGNKQSYYGAFPAGFLHRARQMLGVRRNDPVLHVCGGLVRECLYRGFEPNDRTADLDPNTKPDYLMDVRRLGVDKGDVFPSIETGQAQELEVGRPETWRLWPAVMIDRPYTTTDHAEYDVPSDVFPADLNDLLKRALQCVEPGGRVGVLDYLWPSPPTKLGKEVAVIAVGTGRNNRARWFTVFERLVQGADDETLTAREDEGAVEADSPRPSPIEEPSPPTPPAPSPSPAPSRRRGRRSTSASANQPAPTIAPSQTPDPATIPKGRQCFPAPPETDCVACGGTGKNSKGGECVCVSRMTPADKRAFLDAVRANVCHGCKEGLLLDGPGMNVIEPLTDKPNRWHQACWEQKQRDEEKRRKNEQERVLREAQEKGWPICGGCARPIQPTQKNVNGRHAACGKPTPRRRRRAASGSGFDKGF